MYNISEKEFIKALEKAKFKPHLVEKYEDIDSTLPLLKGVYIPSNSHIGQRKCVLSAIQFYAGLDPGTVIYAGSAPGEATPVLLKLFPHLNFIFIDPHYHIMDYEFQYIYKKVHPNVSESGYTINRSERGQYLMNFINKLKKVKCGKKWYNALKTESFGKEDLSDFISFDHHDCRLMVIQDFVSFDLGIKLKAKIREFSNDPIYYVSDIRSGNNDSNILFDNALQLIVQKALEGADAKTSPILAQYKFVLPKYENPERFAVQDWMQSVFDIAKDYGFDFVQEYKDNVEKIAKGKLSDIKYTYLSTDSSNEGVFLQTWARCLSGETRLVTYGKGSKVYDCVEWREKFNYHNFYRAYCFNPKSRETKFQKSSYCGCSDCALEINIINNVIKSNTSSDLSFVQLKKLIDKVAFRGLSKHLFRIKDKNVPFSFETYTNRFVFKDGKVIQERINK